MLEQYNHHLYVLVCTPGTTAENGDYVPGTSEWTYWGKCREETNGKGEAIVTTDQKSYVFSSLVQLPVGTPRVAEGMRIAVSDTVLETGGMTRQGISDLEKSGTVRLSGSCAKFDSGRLHCRMWV